MRIVSYNILDGGIGRADPLAEIILAQRPDIVALVEADDEEVVHRIAARAKMDFIHARGGKKGVALLSHWPIVETIDHAAIGAGEKPFPKSFLEVMIHEPSGREWLVGVIHLSTKAKEENEARREAEIAVVLDVLKRHRDSGRPYLLVGDFNSNAPHQQIDPDKCKPETREAWHANGGQIPRRVVQRVLDAGYVDSLHAFDADQAGTMGSFSTQFPGQRVDYVFVFGAPDIMIQQAWIEQDRLAKYASDHFPVGAELTQRGAV